MNDAMQQRLPANILYGGDYNPEQWSEDVWLDDMRLMRLAHVNMVSINIFSWAALEPESGQYHFERLDRIMDMLAEHGIAADLATATASPPTWMSRAYPEMLPITREGLRMSHGSRQHYCPNSPDYRRKAADLVQRLAERYVNHPALKMWHINNEYGCHISQCYCDNCAEAFRNWLQERYQSLERLNFAWGTSFWSQHYYHWEDILPPRLSPTFNNPGQRLDYWHFMSDALLACYQVEEEILRAVTPDVPLTTNLMVDFKAVDAFTWARQMDIVAFDTYPTLLTPAWQNAFSHDLMRSLKAGQAHIVMEQSPSQVNWQAQNPQKRPGQMRLQSLQAIAHGAEGIMFFQWRQSQAGAEQYHGAIVTHEGNEHTRIFRQAAQVGEELARLSPEVKGSRITADVALVMDWQNWWAVEYQPGPSDRVKYMEQIQLYYQALHQLNIAVDVIEPDRDLSGYRLLVAPMLHMLRPGVAKNLEQFVAQGSTLLTTFFSGIIDQHGHIGLGGYPAELRRLLGLHVEEIDPWLPTMSNELVINEGELQGTYPVKLWGELIHLEGAQALGTFARDYYAHGPALTVNNFGAGYAYYVATQLPTELLSRLISKICQDAQVEPILPTSAEIEVTKRVRADGRTLYFLLNHAERTHIVTLPGGTFRSLLDDRQVSSEIEMAATDVAVLLEQ